MAPRVDPLIGARLGEYEVLQKIGVGGMGAVYEGRHPLIGKRVSVKVLHAHLSSEPQVVQRFLDEARAVNEVRHRGIVDIFAFGQLPDGAHYFVMELLEGKGFDHIIRDSGAVAPGLALAYLAEILDALGAAHNAGIIHRDLKPSNLFLVDSGRGRPFVKVLDFGIAKLQRKEEQVTRAQGLLMGTPAYMAPEQVLGKAVTASSDLYSLGMVLFELLTGSLAFNSTDPLRMMRHHVETEAPRPSSLVASVPPELDSLVAWMVKKNPAERPRTCEELLPHVMALHASFGGSPISTPQPMPGDILATREAFSPTFVGGLQSGEATPLGLEDLGPTRKSPTTREVPESATQTRDALAPRREPGQAAKKKETRTAPTPHVATVMMASPAQVEVTDAGPALGEAEAAGLRSRSSGKWVLAAAASTAIALLSVGLSRAFSGAEEPAKPSPELGKVAAAVTPPVQVPPELPPPEVLPEKQPLDPEKPVEKLPELKPPVKKPVNVASTRIEVAKPTPLKNAPLNKAPLFARIGRIEGRLSAVEKKRGSADAVNRQFLQAIKGDLKKATEPAEVKDLAEQIDQLDKSIPAP